MAVKIKIDSRAGKALGFKTVNGKLVRSTSSLVPEVRKEFRRIGPKSIRQKLLQNVRAGLSPVDGKGRFKKYSKGYRDEIRRARSKRMREANPKKRPTKVTLNLSGTLHRSLKLFTSGGFTETFKLVFDWDNFLADIHNNLGAGKSKIVRRILPTKKGETFNESINDEILLKLNNAAKNVIRKFFL